jgi:peroxiredoxin
MTKYSFALVTLLAAAAAAPAAHAQAVPGQPAPAFELTDVNGRRVQLSGLRGKFVVLEWNNPSCPFVRKHYDSGNMQALQKRYTQKNVVWLTINSTAPTHDEYRKPAELATWIKQQSAVPSAAMLDPDGRVGRAYGARTTPHMYVIDPQGVVAYAGAIDDKRSTNPADTKSAHNYVAGALDEALAGKPIRTPSTTAYGCSVKYAG